jgi:hypothetical protein
LAGEHALGNHIIYCGLSHELLAGFASFSLKMIPPASMSSIDIRKYPARELPVSA